MIRSSTNPDPFNGSYDMVSVSASVDEKAAACSTEVVVTTRMAGGSVWSTTIVIPPFAEGDACPILNRLRA